jgi:hypothetical protein
MKKSLAALAALALPLSLAVAGVPAHAATPTACTGVSGCKIVTSSDIDGDTRNDSVGVASTGLKDDLWGVGSITVRVRTATGRVMQTTGSEVDWYYAPYQGVAAIDGVKGNEIVVGDTAGAHALQFRVITVRSGKLVSLSPPPGSSLTRSSRWATDGSYSYQMGWSRTVSPNGKVTLTRKLAERQGIQKHNGQTNTYEWKSNKWVKASSKKVVYRSDKSAYAIGGWHIRGVRVFP